MQPYYDHVKAMERRRVPLAGARPREGAAGM